MTNIIKDYLRICYDVAKDSPDPSNQCGAIILNGNMIVSKGRNEIIPGTQWTPGRLLDREWKLAHIEHAERSSLYNLAKIGYKIQGLTMICPWFSCFDCSRAILLTGIKKVIGHQERMDETPDRWKDSVKAGLKLLKNGGVELEFFSGKVGGDSIIVNGKEWYP